MIVLLYLGLGVQKYKLNPLVEWENHKKHQESGLKLLPASREFMFSIGERMFPVGERMFGDAECMFIIVKHKQYRHIVSFLSL